MQGFSTLVSRRYRSMWAFEIGFVALIARPRFLVISSFLLLRLLQGLDGDAVWPALQAVAAPPVLTQAEPLRVEKGFRKECRARRGLF